MAKKSPKFVADSMLGSIARKLRIFGFDTLYVSDSADSEILRIGLEQSRVILTADKEFFKRVVKVGANGVLVNGGSDYENLVHILSRSGITSVGDESIGSRCSICNGLLEEKARDEVKSEIPEKVTESPIEFFQCIDCGKVYWDGSHIRQIRALAKSIDLKLGKTH